MNVKAHLKVDAESFFDLLKESLVADIAAARGKKAKPSNVHEGYSYQRFLGGKADASHAATVRITRFDPPRSYRSTVTTASGTTVMGYDVEPAADGGIDVTYCEEFEGSSAANAALQNVAATFRRIGGKKRIRTQLQSIEAHILADRYPEPKGEPEDDGAAGKDA